MRLVVKLISLLVVAVPLIASPRPPQDRTAIQEQLLRIEREIAQANGSCDYEYFRKIEAPEFIFTDSQGSVTTRDEDLAGEKDCKRHEDQHDFDELRVIPMKESAVLSARHTVSGERNGKSFRVQTRFTDVFVWRDGRWQLVAGHSSRIPADAQRPGPK